MHPTRILCASLLLLAALLTALPGQDISYRRLEKGDYTVFEDGVTPRARARANYYVKQGENPWATSPGQISIEYGQPPWKEEYAALLEKMPSGRRWRLGSNFWTNLFSSFPFTVAGRQVGAGFYFLVLERSSAQQWSLVILEPQQMTRRQLDPWHIGRKDSGEGIRIPLQWEQKASQAGQLLIELKLEDEDPKRMKLSIHFGPHRFTTPSLQISADFGTPQ